MSRRPATRPTVTTPHGGRHRREHGVASVDRLRTITRRQDLHRHVGRVDGPHDPKRSHREVVHRSVFVDGETLGSHPTECHVGGTDAIRTKHGLVENVSAPHTNVDSVVVDLGPRLGTVG